MIGMVAFIVDVPGSVTDPGTVLPVQIFMWRTLPSACLSETSAAIMVLLAFLIVMNAAAIFIRKKLERRW